MGISITEVSSYAKNEEEIPFTKQYAPFPVKKKRKMEDVANEPPKSKPKPYVPDFLPPFPEERTYNISAVRSSIDGFFIHISKCT